MKAPQLLAWNIALDYAQALNRHIEAGNHVLYRDHVKLTKPLVIVNDGTKRRIEWNEGHLSGTFYASENSPSVGDVHTFWTSAITVSKPIYSWHKVTP